MKRGPWHQCGDRSQKLVEEQLQQGIGVGVIVSPRDLTRARAVDYAQKYRALGADVLLDHQFYVPDFTNRRLDSYPISAFRNAISTLNTLTALDFTEIANQLRIDHQDLGASAVLAPAVVYEAGRPDIVQLNARLFAVAQDVASSLSLPVYATVVLGRSVTSSDQTISSALANATALDADGWYFAFEFEDERVPSSRDSVRRCCAAGLTLACTGKPVLHAYAGLLGPMSFGFGATGAALGHSQNLWKFTRDRWQPPTNQGGGGDAPARFFSARLWGTIVYPDETIQLSNPLRAQVMTPSPFSGPVTSNLPWGRWEAGKHLVSLLASTFADMAQTSNARQNMLRAQQMFSDAAQLHRTIQQAGVFLGDNTNAYQENWAFAAGDVLNGNQQDFDYLELLT